MEMETAGKQGWASTYRQHFTISIFQSTFSELVCITSSIFTAKFFTKGFAFVYCSHYLYTCVHHSANLFDHWNSVHHGFIRIRPYTISKVVHNTCPPRPVRPGGRWEGLQVTSLFNNLAEHRPYLTVIMPVLPVWLCRLMAESHFAELGDQLLL